MLAFLLSPTRDGTADPDWAWSTYRGSCVVIAESESLARRYAAGAFVVAVASSADSVRPPAKAVWLQDRLVAVRPAPPRLTGTTLPAGGVIAPGHDCPTLRFRPAPAVELDQVGEAGEAAQDFEVAQAFEVAEACETVQACEVAQDVGATQAREAAPISEVALAGQ